MKENFRLYEETKKTHFVLSGLVSNISVVELEDSLQRIARLPKSDQNKIIQGIIQEEIKKEQQEAEEKRIKQQLVYESGINRGREQFGQNTSGGKWYFYNPATLSFGLSEFRKKWGTRKLEDNWRRKDKKNITGFDTDTITSDTVFSETQNTKDPDYY